MGAPVVHFEVFGKDAKKLQKFYSSMFGWTIDANNPMNYGLVSTGSKLGFQGGIGQAQPGQPLMAIFYIAVDKPQTYLDKIVKAGGKVIVPVTVIPNMVTFAQFADPDGNVVGIVANVMPTTPKVKKSPAKKTTSAEKKPGKK